MVEMYSIHPQRCGVEFGTLTRSRIRFVDVGIRVWKKTGKGKTVFVHPFISDLCLGWWLGLDFITFNCLGSMLIYFFVWPNTHVGGENKLSIITALGGVTFKN